MVVVVDGIVVVGGGGGLPVSDLIDTVEPGSVRNGWYALRAERHRVTLVHQEVDLLHFFGVGGEKDTGLGLELQQEAALPATFRGRRSASIRRGKGVGDQRLATSLERPPRAMAPGESEMNPRESAAALGTGGIIQCSLALRARPKASAGCALARASPDDSARRGGAGEDRFDVGWKGRKTMAKLFDASWAGPTLPGMFCGSSASHRSSRLMADEIGIAIEEEPEPRRRSSRSPERHRRQPDVSIESGDRRGAGARELSRALRDEKAPLARDRRGHGRGGSRRYVGVSWVLKLATAREGSGIDAAFRHLP